MNMILSLRMVKYTNEVKHENLEDIFIETLF